MWGIGVISSRFISCYQKIVFESSQVSVRFEKLLDHNKTCYTGCKIFTLFFPNCINCYPLMRTINSGKNLYFFIKEIKPIKTPEFRFMQFGKKKGKTVHPVLIPPRRAVFDIEHRSRMIFGLPTVPDKILKVSPAKSQETSSGIPMRKANLIECVVERELLPKHVANINFIATK